jgi:hypothetical protein
MEVSMNDLTVRQLEMSNRVVEFFNENAIPFRKGSPGPELVNQFQQAVSEIQDLTAAQVSEFAQSRVHSELRGETREALCEALDQIARTSRGMAASVPGVNGKFQPVHGLGDAKLKTHALSFAENAKPFLKDFVNFEMAPDFLDDLEAKIEAFAKAVVNHTSAKSAHVATSQLVDQGMKRAMNILVQLDPIVENKLRSDPALLLQWENIRRIERAWVTKKPKPSKPPADPPAEAA